MEKKNVEVKKWLTFIIVALVGYWIVNNIDVLGNLIKIILEILSPLILGGCLAFILNIPMSFFERNLSKVKSKKKKKTRNKRALRIMAIIFAVLVIILVLVLIITLIVPELINVGKMLIGNLPLYIDEISKLVKQFGNNLPDINDIIQEMNIDKDSIKDDLINKISGLVTSSLSVISNIISAVTNFFIGVVFAIYILIDKEKLKSQAKRLLYAYLKKERADRIIRVANVSSRIFKNFFTVQCLEAIILGVLCMIGMLILKIPYAVSIGILVGVTALIPIVGAFIGVAIGSILIVSVEPFKVIVFIIFFLILQQIEGNLIYPRVVGNSVGLPGMLVLAAVAIGGSLGGIFGMLLGVPVASIIYALLKEDVKLKLNEHEKETKIVQSNK